MRPLAWVLAAALMAAGAAVFVLRRSSPPAAAPPSAAAPRRPGAAAWVLPARIRAQHVVAVAAPVEGVVDSLLVEVGEQVYEGQLLGHIRNDSLAGDEQAATEELQRAQERLSDFERQEATVRLEAARARADASRLETAFETAERVYLRQQMLYREGATPRLVYEESAREYDSAKTARDSAAELARSIEDRLADLARTADSARRTADEDARALEDAKQRSAAADIRSPATGLLVARTRRAGEQVTPDLKDLFVIATDTTALEAVLTPDPASLARLHPGQEVIVSTAEAPLPISARIDEIRGGEAIIRFTAPEGMTPGSTAQVRIKAP